MNVYYSYSAMYIYVYAYVHTCMDIHLRIRPRPIMLKFFTNYAFEQCSKITYYAQ